MNVERQHHIIIVLWSDLIHITLWRNDGFIHSFHNFSKCNAFSENLIRTKFILHKIFYQMSMLSSSKTSWIFFALHSKTTFLGFQLIIIIITCDKLMTFPQISAQFFMIFSNTFNFRRGWVGEVGVVMFCFGVTNPQC